MWNRTPLTAGLALLLALNSSVAAGQEADEPGMTRVAPAPAQMAPARRPQVIDIDAPDTPPRPWPEAPQLRAAPLPSRGPFLRLSAGAGYGGFAALLSEPVRGPVFGGTLAMTFGGGSVKHGLRLGGFMIYQPDGDRRNESTVYGVNLGYVAQFEGLWLSPAIGLVHLKQLGNEFGEDMTLPEVLFGLGYDIGLGRHFALRLSGEIGTFLISWRATASADLVLRF